MAKDLRNRILDALAGRRGNALFLSELDARLPGDSSADVERAVAELTGDRVLVVDHPSPDPHFAGDLRIVALADPADPDRARRSADLLWSQWVREVLSHHRCT